ncbi:transcriptional regulator [Paracoccus sp. JM45]|nr:transcriptional regulator [Paracoccus sp. JM45]
MVACSNLPQKLTIIDSDGAIIMTTIRNAADLGRAIRARRLELGLQQTELAMQSGVSTPTVSAIENGKETARVGLVLQLCRDLGIQLSVGT